MPDAELFFITGADALADIFTWRDVDELFDLATFVGCTRPGYTMDPETLAKIPSDKVTMIEIPALAISSTDCRDRHAPRRTRLVPRAGRRRPVHRQARPLQQGPCMTATDHALGLVAVAAQAAHDKKADQVLAFDVSEQIAITDAFVLASATNERAVKAIVDEVEDKLREAGAKPIRREGHKEGRWVLLDYGEIVDARPARGGADVLRPRAPVERLPGDPARPDVSLRRTLVVLRHGRTAWNDAGRAQGHADIDAGRGRARRGPGRGSRPGQAHPGADLVQRPVAGAPDRRAARGGDRTRRRSRPRACVSSTWASAPA